jgi:hypothetical protein
MCTPILFLTFDIRIPICKFHKINTLSPSILCWRWDMQYGYKLLPYWGHFLRHFIIAHLKSNQFEIKGRLLAAHTLQRTNTRPSARQGAIHNCHRARVSPAQLFFARAADSVQIQRWGSCWCAQKADRRYGEKGLIISRSVLRDCIAVCARVSEHH